MPFLADEGRSIDWRRAIAAALLVSAIVALIVLRRPPFLEKASTDSPDPLERYGFVLEDVARQVGIDFRHEAPVLDRRLEPIMPLIASLGAAVSIVDYNRDGWPDIYATTSAIGGRNALYR